jgi:hypothetical protein
VTRVHHRNSRWHMALWLYPVTVLLGSLPWSMTWIGAVSRLRRAAGWRGLVVGPRRLFLVA